MRASDDSRRYIDDLWRQIRDGSGTLLHEIRCVKCSEAVLQLWQLHPWCVILTRTTKPNTDPIPEMSAADLARYRQNRQKSNQLDRDWLLIPITDDDLKPSRHTHTTCPARASAGAKSASHCPKFLRGKVRGAQ